MAGGIGSVFSLVIIVGLLAVTICAAVVVFRGRKYWATWLMLVGSIVQALGVVAAVAAVYIALVGFRAISSGGSASGLASSLNPSFIIGLFTLLIPLGLLLFAVGLLGICSRFGSLESRAAELETLNLQLQDRLQG